jgi:hypothetical protein
MNAPRLLPDNRTKRSKKALAAEKRANALSPGWYKLDVKVRKPIPVDGPPTRSGLKCPRCQGQMIRRNGKYGEFYGCAGWPACNGTRGTDGYSDDEIGVPPPGYDEDRDPEYYAFAFLHDVGDRL